MDNQQFVLRWHYQQSTLTCSLPNLLESNILTDVTLSADNQNIKAHKLVLATCSNYFLQLFKDMGPIIHPVIILHNVPYEDLKALISFIYKGQCLVTKQQIPSLLSVAKLLKIQGLCDIKLEDYLCKKSNAICPVDVCKPTNKFEEMRECRATDIAHNMLPEIKQEMNEHRNNNVENINGHIIDEQLKLEIRDDIEHSLSHSNISKKLNKDIAETCKCFICGKYLSNQYNLRVHMETHEETYHACQSCPHISRSRDALRKHVSYRHPEEYSVRKRKRNDH